MSKQLKEALVNKMDVKPSAHFDAAFFNKLEKEKNRPLFFSNWIAWAISGCACASVLFVTFTNNQPHYRPIAKSTINHQEYLESALEFQNTLNEDVSPDSDLTGSSTDEI